MSMKDPQLIDEAHPPVAMPATPPLAPPPMDDEQEEYYHHGHHHMVHDDVALSQDQQIITVSSGPLQSVSGGGDRPQEVPDRKYQCIMHCGIPVSKGRTLL
jgi:hypothetical protein